MQKSIFAWFFLLSLYNLWYYHIHWFKPHWALTFILVAVNYLFLRLLFFSQSYVLDLQSKALLIRWGFGFNREFFGSEKNAREIKSIKVYETVSENSDLGLISFNFFSGREIILWVNAVDEKLYNYLLRFSKTCNIPLFYNETVFCAEKDLPEDSNLYRINFI
ncbi:hypothetical protein ACFL35_03995 [Candidatus Riflebacteria bacterium]